MRSLTATEGLLMNRANLFSAGSDFDLRALFGVAGSAEDGPPSAVAATAFRLGLIALEPNTAQTKNAKPSGKCIRLCQEAALTVALMHHGLHGHLGTESLQSSVNYLVKTARKTCTIHRKWCRHPRTPIAMKRDPSSPPNAVKNWAIPVADAGAGEEATGREDVACQLLR